MTNGETTRARVLAIEKGDKITLPSEFFEEIGKSHGLAILILKDKNVKIYPVDSKRVLYLKLEIEKLSKSFLEELTLIFEESHLEDILFTSGICQSTNKCYYECYFTPDQLNISETEFEDKLKGITGIQKVILKAVE